MNAFQPITRTHIIPTCIVYCAVVCLTPLVVIDSRRLVAVTIVTLQCLMAVGVFNFLNSTTILRLAARSWGKIPPKLTASFLILTRIWMLCGFEAAYGYILITRMSPERPTPWLLAGFVLVIGAHTIWELLNRKSGSMARHF